MPSIMSSRFSSSLSPWLFSLALTGLVHLMAPCLAAIPYEQCYLQLEGLGGSQPYLFVPLFATEGGSGGDGGTVDRMWCAIDAWETEKCTDLLLGFYGGNWYITNTTDSAPAVAYLKHRNCKEYTGQETCFDDNSEVISVSPHINPGRLLNVAAPYLTACPPVRRPVNMYGPDGSHDPAELGFASSLRDCVRNHRPHGYYPSYVYNDKENKCYGVKSISHTPAKLGDSYGGYPVTEATWCRFGCLTIPGYPVFEGTLGEFGSFDDEYSCLSFALASHQFSGGLYNKETSQCYGLPSLLGGLYDTSSSWSWCYYSVQNWPEVSTTSTTLPPDCHTSLPNFPDSNLASSSDPSISKSSGAFGLAPTNTNMAALAVSTAIAVAAVSFA